ncbi:hypothetical protein [Streptomyces sp. NPDC051001]|uniref:hypothetical protein n=1 Tax=Streptomyces sp. NPDC051001 TaxID=3155795 RepID=UPI00341DED6B
MAAGPGPHIKERRHARLAVTESDLAIDGTPPHGGAARCSARAALQPEQEPSAPEFTSEPVPPYDSDKQQRPGLAADMRTPPRYRARRYRASGKHRR